MAGKIFLNYRRSDADAWADRVHERLMTQFTRDDVFMDIDGTIPLGLPWADWLDSQVAKCDLMLVLIGRAWIAGFQARSDSGERDNVRVEIESALARKIPVVPVFLGDTPVPSCSSLPASIRPLLELQASRLQRVSFEADVKTLIAGVVRSIELARGPTIDTSRPPSGVQTMTASEAIDAAATIEDGVSGSIKMVVQNTRSEDNMAWLMSETDYRNPRCLSIEINGKARIELAKLHGEDPVVFFKGRTILVHGTAKKQQIVFIVAGEPTGQYYYQTQVNVTDAGQLEVVIG